VTIGNSVTTIGNYAFRDCIGLTSVTWNAKNYSNFSSSSYTPFNGLTGITSFVFGNEVEHIPAYLCYGLTGLTSVSIPNSVTSIGYAAFWDCRGLTTITSLATTAPTISNNTFQNIKTNGTLHVPAGSDYSSWMSTSDYYLGKYNWTKVEDA
jgi:hypothetical protein